MTTRPRLRSSWLPAGICAALIMVGAGPAHADTATAAASAATLTLAGGSTATSGTLQASSDGTAQTSSGAPRPALTVLGTQSLITSGVLVQSAVARTDGTSAACAGMVGSGGSITIGADGSCTTVAGTGGVAIRLLGGLTPVDLLADAIVSRCTATSAGVTTAGVSLVNARVSTAVVLNLASNPAPGTVVTVPGVAELRLNGLTAPQGAGSVRVSALYVSLASSTVRVDLGQSRCGLNVVTMQVPAVPVTGWAVAALAVLVTWGALATRWVRARWTA